VTGAARVLLYWLPLGAGGRSVRYNGRLFEAFVARRERRPVRDLYRSALQIHLGDDRFAIEMTPAWGSGTADRGVVREGPVGSRWLGHFAAFRYEGRRWRMGVVADVGAAVDSPWQIGDDVGRAREVPRFTESSDHGLMAMEDVLWQHRRSTPMSCVPVRCGCIGSRSRSR
jgi:hypothetical protein